MAEQRTLTRQDRIDLRALAREYVEAHNDLEDATARRLEALSDEDTARMWVQRTEEKLRRLVGGRSFAIRVGKALLVGDVQGGVCVAAVDETDEADPMPEPPAEEGGR